MTALSPFCAARSSAPSRSGAPAPAADRAIAKPGVVPQRESQVTASSDPILHRFDSQTSDNSSTFPAQSPGGEAPARADTSLVRTGCDGDLGVTDCVRRSGGAAHPSPYGSQPLRAPAANAGKLRLLDLFCCAGGAGMGYHQAGFDVVGVDIKPQPRYPFEFIQADVMSLDPAFLASFDAIHASPPCQRYSQAQRLMKNDHPDLVIPVERMLKEAGRPYIIENVPGAPLFPTITLCGGMFPELRVYRHRLFKGSFNIYPPAHPPHTAPQVKMGRPIRQGDFIQVVGNFSGAAYAREAMGIDWMTRDELREAIPPAYTRFIGRQLMAHLAAQDTLSESEAAA